MLPLRADLEELWALTEFEEIGQEFFKRKIEQFAENR